jgi:hypothetical protein
LPLHPDDAVVFVSEINVSEEVRKLLCSCLSTGERKENRGPGFYGQTCFNQGIDRFKVFLNDVPAILYSSTFKKILAELMRL